jgi:ElaB/YqjD/DUF883 family membrane-anchored ribosome-binding protein
MAKTNEHNTVMTQESADRFSSQFDELKTSLGQLREDVSKLLSHASGTAKSGAGMLKEQAAHLRDRGVESFEHAERRIGQRPVSSVLWAFGIGFIFAKLFLGKR